MDSKSYRSENGMAEFTQGKIKANGIEQHYYRAENPGKPVMILLHGITDNGLCWVAVARALREQYDIYMLDARGHGFTEAPETGYGSRERAADVAGFIQATGVDRPVLFGHSMGADTAMTTAAHYPERVRAIILEDPPFRLPTPMREKIEMENAAQEYRANILRGNVASTADLIAQARVDNPQWPEIELEPWAESKRQVNPNVSQVIFGLRESWREALPRITCPVLLITADPDRGAIVRAEIAREAAGLWKSGRMVHIPGAGHSVHRDQFDRTMQAVREFLKEI